MVYPNNIEQKIDFQVLRDRLNAACSSSLGREQVQAMHFETDYETVCTRLGETKEMQYVLSDSSLNFPQGEIHDMRESLGRIRVEGLYMDEQELFHLQKTLAYASELESFFAGLDKERFPYLYRWSEEQSQPVGKVVELIGRVLNRYGSLKDNASPELARIRHDLQQAQGAVGRAIQSVLKRAQAEGWVEKDTSPTLREGRLVLPVPPGSRKKIGGIVHDESASGKTVFIEPQEVVEANNRIRSLEAEEKREKTRILIEVTSQIRPFVPGIVAAESKLARVDFVHAKALLGRQLGAIAPEMTNQPMLSWQDARHAILYLRLQSEAREVVPMSIRLGGDEKNRLLVVSGPNAGGKSVCLKTVALTQYMLQCGLTVPVSESSKAGIFNHLLLDIGDEQSLQDDLSTYSSHLRNMKTFVRLADSKTLYLIDEMGGGTEPAIGGAIAEATLNELHRTDAIGVVTTHYANLKHLAEREEGMVNGAMLYDRGALRPLFQLSVGQAGSSFALEIARQIGLPESIIHDATVLVGEEHIDYDKQLQDIARDKRYWENKRQAIRQREKHLEEKIAYYEQEIAGLKAKKKQVLAEAKEQAADILQQSNATIERTIREIKESKADKQKTQKARQRIEVMKQKVADGKDEKKVMRDFSELKKMAKAMPSVSTSVQNTIRSHKLRFERTIDLRGLRADEALEQVIAYMDTAIMVAADSVTILHGTGTGALKQLTRDYLATLKKKKRITDYYDGDPNRGGAGITIVEL